MFDSSCNEIAAVKEIADWAKGEYAGTCIWVPSNMQTATRDNIEKLKSIQSRIELAHHCGFITFYSLLKNAADPHNSTVWNSQLVKCAPFNNLISRK